MMRVGYGLLCFLILQLYRTSSAQTLDQLMTNAMRSSASSAFIQDNGTVLVELDILYKAEDWERLQHEGRISAQDIEAGEPDDHSRSRRKAINYESKRWTSKTIPYYMQQGFSSSDRQQIDAAMRDWMFYTCLKFRPASGDSNYIYIQDGGGCSSYVGMNGGSQAVTLARGCRIKRIIIHELGHAIGFNHEQTRADRDSYVTIYHNNILSSTLFNFDKYSSSYSNSHGVSYDYGSVMHYGQYAFSSNGSPTIITKDRSWQHKIGNAQGLSFADIKLANKIYSCGANCGGKTCGSRGFLDKHCKCQCPGNPITPCGDDDGDDDDDDDDGDEGDCEDLHEHCQSWASSGECQANADYMLVSCAKSCEQCTDDNGGGGGGGSNCDDGHPNCGTWAASGECSANPIWMQENCRVSCKTCDDGGGQTCNDHSDNCEYWSGAGYCTSPSHRDWMNENCPASCGTCGQSDQTGSDNTGNSCVDAPNQDCANRAGSGQCYQYASWMRQNCARSCGIC